MNTIAIPATVQRQLDYFRRTADALQAGIDNAAHLDRIFGGSRYRDETIDSLAERMAALRVSWQDWLAKVPADKRPLVADWLDHDWLSD